MATKAQTQKQDEYQDGYADATTGGDQFSGGAANFANTARAQVGAYIDKLEAMVREGRDLLVEMDARLERFDSGSRRLTETTKEQRDNHRENVDPRY